MDGAKEVGSVPGDRNPLEVPWVGLDMNPKLWANLAMPSDKGGVIRVEADSNNIGPGAEVRAKLAVGLQRVWFNVDLGTLSVLGEDNSCATTEGETFVVGEEGVSVETEVHRARSTMVLLTQERDAEVKAPPIDNPLVVAAEGQADVAVGFEKVAVGNIAATTVLVGVLLVAQE